MVFRLWTAVPHCPLHHGIWSDPTETCAEYVVQVGAFRVRGGPANGQET